MIRIKWREFYNYRDQYATELTINGERVTTLLYTSERGWEIFGGLWGGRYDDLRHALREILSIRQDINSLPKDEESRKKVQEFLENVARLELA